MAYSFNELKIEIDRLRAELAQVREILSDREARIAELEAAGNRLGDAAIAGILDGNDALARAEKAEAELAEAKAECEKLVRLLTGGGSAAYFGELAEAKARIAELEATRLYWTSELARLMQNSRDDQDRAKRAKVELDISREALRMVQSALLSQAAETERVEAERDAMMQVCVGVDAVASIEEEIGFSKDWTPMWIDTVTRARAALAPSPDGREG